VCHCVLVPHSLARNRRIMAHMTQCSAMIEALEAGGDFHSRTAIDMYDNVREACDKGEVRTQTHPSRAAWAAADGHRQGHSLDPCDQRGLRQVLLEWDKSKGEAPAPMVKDKYASERRKAKTLNFSIAYGKTAHGLAKDWGVSLREATETIDKWYAARKEVRKRARDRWGGSHAGVADAVFLRL